MSKNRLKKYLTFQPEVNRIFDELDQFREFCRDFGYMFDEAHLGTGHSSYSDFQRWQTGKLPKDNWGYLIKQTRKNA